MARTDPQVNFRIPGELYEKLKIAAAENSRTLTAELVYRIDQSFAHPEGLVGRDLVSGVLTQLLDSGVIEFTEGGSGLLANLKKRIEDLPPESKGSGTQRKR